MKIKDLLNLTQDDINTMSTSEIRKTIKDLGSRANRTIKEIRNAGLDKYELGRFLNRKQIRDNGFLKASEIKSANAGRNQIKLLKMFYSMPHTVKQQLDEQTRHRKEFLQNIGKIPTEYELKKKGFSEKEVSKKISEEMNKYERSYQYIDDFMSLYNKAAEEELFSQKMDKAKYEKFREEAYDFFERMPEFRDSKKIDSWDDVASESQWGEMEFVNEKAEFIERELDGLLDHQKVDAYNNWDNPIIRLKYLAEAKINKK